MEHNVIEWKFWTCNYVQVAIVAVRGDAGDWAAYAGGTYRAHKEAETVQAAAKNGDKLSETLARAIFPGIEGCYRE